MSKKNWSNILSMLARSALAFLFVFGQTAWAGEKPEDRPSSNAEAKSQQTPANPSAISFTASNSGDPNYKTTQTFSLL